VQIEPVAMEPTLFTVSESGIFSIKTLVLMVYVRVL